MIRIGVTIEGQERVTGDRWPRIAETAATPVSDHAGGRNATRRERCGQLTGALMPHYNHPGETVRGGTQAAKGG